MEIPEQRRRFTAAEAEAALPEVGAALARLRATRPAIRAAYPALDALLRKESGGVAATALFGALQEHRAAIRRLESIGVVLRDPDSGLVDFLGEREGQPVWLCWRLADGERLGWWHPIDRGVADRRPL